MRTITVALGEKTYNIEIAAGLLDQIGAKARVLSQAVKAAIISDSNVDPLYGERLERSLAASGFEVTRIVFAAGEQSKNLTVLGQVYDELARAGLTRSDLILTLGGGVPGDLGGFAAATFLRGIDFIQVPTSLLAQIDSSVGGKVAIDIYQRVPVMRVMSSNGNNYYLDNAGKIMTAAGKSIHVVVATGFIDRKFAQTELYPLGKFLQSDKFWESQIEQINVTPKQELELVPRVGEHILFLGKPGNYKEKFSKLRTFYQSALNRVGWNKYERISIEFNNQIICTKKEK